MELGHITFHDSRLKRVVELPETDDLLMEVDYVTDWELSVYELRLIAFRDVLNYEVHEGPFAGCPVILEVNEVGQEQGRSRLRIETNAGYRVLLCSKVELVLPDMESI